jgi:hypothetical protein
MVGGRMLRYLAVGGLFSGGGYAQTTTPEPTPLVPDTPSFEFRSVIPPAYRVPELPLTEVPLSIDQLRDLLTPDDSPRRPNPCAIPLTKVPTAPNTGFAIDQRQPEAQPPMSRVRPPAPPCSSADGLFGATRINPEFVHEVRIRLEEQAEEESNPAEPVP